jgi:hypothetical protein
MDTMKNPSPVELAHVWKHLAGCEMDPDAAACLAASIRSWPTGRLATGAERHGNPVIVSWQAVGGSTYVTLR